MDFVISKHIIIFWIPNYVRYQTPISILSGLILIRSRNLTCVLNFGFQFCKMKKKTLYIKGHNMQITENA